MPHRPYFKTPVEDLEKLFKEHIEDRQVLGDLWSELTYRKTDRAKQLRREIEGILGDEVPRPPKPPKPPSPDDQLDLIE